MIRVIKPGIFMTVQDLGRTGLAHLGVSPAGAADSVSFRIANLLVGNDWNAPALEITLSGPTLEFEVPAVIAISGSHADNSLPINEPFELAAGTRLVMGSLLDGARAYLAVRGGIAVPKVMHSCSTFLPAKIGGYQGRALKAGDSLAIGKQVVGDWRRFPAGFKADLWRGAGPIRVTQSLQYDWFGLEAVHQFEHETFTVSDDSNRSGLRLIGQPILPTKRSELVTEGIALGAVQVLPDGQLVVLFVDQQTTGGYPKIANVIAADFPRVAQLRPREKLAFQFVTIPEAIELLRQQELALMSAFTV
jgi:antagonist of KipI